MGRLQVELSRGAERDLRRLDAADRRRAAKAIESVLVKDPLPANADDRPLRGRQPWRRLRIGQLRILHRPFDRGGAQIRLVGRVIHRRDLERVADNL